MDSVIGKPLNMFGTTWLHKPIFSSVSFMKSKYRCISNENFVSKLSCVKYIADFKD